jgi:hypothetical protein
LGVRRGEPVLAIERRWRSTLPGREADRARFLKRGGGTTQGELMRKPLAGPMQQRSGIIIGAVC